MIRDYFAFLSGIALVAALVGLSMPLFSLLLENRGHASGIIGWNGAVPAVAGLIGSALLPLAMRRISIEWLLYAGLAVTAIGLMPLAFTESLPAWFALRFVFGLGLTVLFVVTEVWLSHIAPEAQRGRLVGLYSTVLAAGFALGPALLAVTGTAGLAPFLAGGGLILLAALPLLLAHGRAPKLHTGNPSGHSVLDPIRKAPDLMLAVCTFGAVESIALTLLPNYGLAHGLTEIEAATLLVASGLGNVAVQLPLGWLADHMDRRRLLIVAGLIATAAASLSPFVMHSLPLRWSLIFVWGGSAVALYSVGLVLLGERFKSGGLANANSAFILMYSLGSLIGPPLAGYAMQLWRPDGFVAVIAGLTFLHVVVTAALRPPVSR